MATVLILGAGVFQVPLITTAKKQGHTTIVASKTGDYPGISLADKFFEVNTTDTDAILSLIENTNIDAILTTGTDVSIPSLAAACEKYNLKGPNEFIAKTVSSKTAFRRFQHNNDLNAPPFLRCITTKDGLNFYKKIQYKIVFKPDDASGSRGVSILKKNISDKIVIDAFNAAKGHSRNGIVCAESFIKGIEVGGDGFLIDGDFVFFTTTHKHMDGVIVRGHSIPGQLPEEKKRIIKEELLKTTNKLGYFNGPINFDVMIDDSKATILEMGVRNGGNGITDIVKYSYSIDLNSLLINYALGKPINVKNTNNPKKTSSLVFGSDKKGTLKYITPFRKLKSKIPNLKKMVLAKTIGENIEPFAHNANLIGYYIIENCGWDDYEQVRNKILKEMVIEVKKQ